MFEVNSYLRCANNHPNEIPLRERETRVGTPCVRCGSPLKAQEPSERRPFNRRF